MPLLKLKSPNRKRIMVMAEKISDIIDAGITKFNLPKEIHYKVINGSLIF